MTETQDVKNTINDLAKGNSAKRKFKVVFKLKQRNKTM